METAMDVSEEAMRLTALDMGIHAHVFPGLGRLGGWYVFWAPNGGISIASGWGSTVSGAFMDSSVDLAQKMAFAKKLASALVSAV